MKKSFLFNISEQEGLPGGPNEVNNNLLGSLSVSQNVYVPYNNAGPRASVNNDVNEDAMRGMMKARMAYEEMHGNPAAKRMVVAPDNPYQFDNGDIGTHYMGSYDNYAVPNIQEVDGKLEMTGPIANEEMKFDRPEDAAYFAEHYKDIAPDPSYREYKKGGDNSTNKKDDGERTYETYDPEEYERLEKEYNAQLKAYNKYKDFYEVDDPYNPTAFRGVGEDKTPYLATEDYLLDQHGVKEGYFPLGKKVIGPDGVPYILGQYLKGKPGESLESHTTSNPAYPVTHTLFDHDLNEGIGTINWNIDDPSSSTHKYHWDPAFENSVSKGDMRYAYEGDKIRAEEEGLPKPLGYAYGISPGGAPDIPIYAKPVKPVYKHATLPNKKLRKLESDLPNKLVTKSEPRQNLHKEYNPYTQQYEVMSPKQKHMLDRAKFLGQDAPEFTGEPLGTSTMRPLQGAELFKYRMQNDPNFRPIKIQDGGTIPEMNLGGLFGKKKSSGEYKPGSWAGNDNSEVKIYQEGEDQFDIPISKAPEAEFSIPEMSEEELQAYLIQSEKDEFERKYKAAYDKYKPETVSYKGIERPKAEFVLAEQYEANPQLYEDAGYTANKLESGNYELFQNKDISNMIYAKGFKPGVFENTYGMGSGEDIEKKFAPIYADAKRIHAERNAKKIDAMLKETVEVEPENYEDFDVNRINPGEGARYSAGKKINPDFFQSSGYKPSTKPKYNNVEEVIDVLVSQGEGTKEGLTQRYMDYTNGLLKERDFDENLRNEAERIYDERFKKKRDELADEVASWNPQGIASVDQPILTPVTDISGNIEWKDNTAYSENLNAIAEYENYVDNELQSEEYIAREALYAIANNEDLTNDQKRELLGDPEKLGNVMKSYSEYRAAPVGAQNAGYSGYYRGGNLKSAFHIDPENLEANWSAGSMPHVIDGGVDMLDEGWIKGTVGVIGAPAAFEALGSAMSYNLGNLVGAGSSAPGWLNMGNVFTGLGVKDVVTDIAPSAIENVQSMASDGINKENSLSLAKDIFEGGTKLLSGTKLLNSMGVLKNAPKITNTSGYNTAKSIYGQGKYGTRIMAEELANNDHNVTDNMKFIKNLGIYMKSNKQYGGPTYAELTDAEIKKYREGGWIIEEI